MNICELCTYYDLIFLGKPRASQIGHPFCTVIPTYLVPFRSIFLEIPTYPNIGHPLSNCYCTHLQVSGNNIDIDSSSYDSTYKMLRLKHVLKVMPYHTFYFSLHTLLVINIFHLDPKLLYICRTVRYL